MSRIVYTPSAIANEFLDRAGDCKRLLTPMQLLKLVYISHGWTLAVTDEPLINERVEAWKYGPVVPSLFHEFKDFGGNGITRLSKSVEYSDIESPTEGDVTIRYPFIEESDENVTELIGWVWKKYGALSGGVLSKITHLPGSPWTLTYKPGLRPSPTIPDALINGYYTKLWADRDKRDV